MCRRTSGAPFVTWMVVPAAAFRYRTGTPTLLESSSRGKRYFCNACGTPLTCVITSRSEHVDVTVGSLDEPDAYPPVAAVHEDSRLGWLGSTEPTADPAG